MKIHVRNLSPSHILYFVAGSDFDPDSAQVIEFTSASVVNIIIGLFGDSVVEGEEWFRGRLRGTNMSGVIVRQDSINITIVDDDSKQLCL